MLSESDRIWNRAALEQGGADAREGDRALAALLLAHGLVMNCGVEHVTEALTEDELSQAVAGYRYFAFDGVADLLEEAHREMSDAEAEAADQRYWAAIPTDAAIAERFRSMLASRRAVFAPA